jgi:AcrR family transcriptional regulator
VARPGKTQRGQQTRARIVGAATRLFTEHGYLDTTMGTIAAEAGVAVQTLYLAFGSKVAILEAAHDVAVVGDDEPVALLDRPWVADLHAEPDGPRALEMAITNTLRVIEQVSAVYGVIQSAAADPEVAELLLRAKSQRLATMRALSEQLATKPGFANGLTIERATDILYTVVSNELHRLLVLERHWTPQAWQTWAYDSAALRLFPQPTPNTNATPTKAKARTNKHQQGATTNGRTRSPRKQLPAR